MRGGFDGQTASAPFLIVSIVGVYGLVLVGATLSLSESLAACQTWPSCDGQWIVPLDHPAAIALGHRILALVVGGLLLATLAVGWRSFPRRTRVAVVGAIALYPIQMGIGAVTAIGGGAGIPSTLHLLTAMLIFGTLVLALAWHLEHTYPQRDERSQSDTGSEVQESVAVDRPGGIVSVAKAYFELTKPRLMWLLCLVALAGMALAAGPALAWSTALATLAGGVLAIGASGTFNHVLERDVDKRMARTAERPIATHVVPVRNALFFGAILAITSIGMFLAFVNVVAAALGLSAIVFYSVIYTLVLKPNTVQNTVIGGAAGALPALIGWAAVTGSITWPGLLLALVIFCWTPAHFYNLAMVYKDDYARGGFPMLPVVHGERVTRKHILLYAGLTMLVVAGLGTVGTLGIAYALVAILGGAAFLGMIYRLHRRQTRRAALQTFHASNGYLGLLLFAIVADALLF